MTRRPAGVIFSAILLGAAAALLLLLAAGTALTTVMMRHLPAGVTTMSGAAPQSAALFAVISIGLAVFYLALAGWAIATLVGLVRMKPWARISVMIIGGGIAVIGILSALLFFAMPTLMANVPTPPTANPALLKSVFIVFAVICLAVATIGIFWLVYFALRRTREDFNPPLQPVLPGAYPAAYVAPPLPHPYSLDFSEAQPIEPPQPPPLYASPDLVYVQPSPPPIASTSGRPISITILAVLFLLSGIGLLPTLLLHYPLFLLGFLIGGSASHVIMLIMLLWTIVTGIGLLTHMKPAWYMAMAYYLFGILNIGILFLPGKLARMSQYMQAINNTMSPGLQPAFDPFGPPLFKLIILPSILFGVALMIFLIVLLWRARWFFGLAPRND